MLKLASVNNVSSTAYDLVPLGKFGTMTHNTPAQIARLVGAGDVDAALLPVACMDSVAGQYESLGDFGISCKGAVGSVLLFCRKPLESIAKKNYPVYVTSHSRTSRELFQYLYHRRFGKMPNVTDHETGAFAHLCIGNESLDVVQSRHHSIETIDLAAWWYEVTKYPFVFARWVVRHDVAEQDKSSLIDWLNESTRVAATVPGQELMVLNNQQIFGSHQRGIKYYSHLKFCLDDEEQIGLALFLTSLRKMYSCSQAV